MAGRGTDIKLGEGVKELGGLCILGTERHESRRIDNQLRGRAGRQGDPGESRFFVSAEDDLMRLFGGDRLKVMMERLNVPDDVPLQNAMVTRSIEGAQKRVEGHHFDIRKHVLQYDDVMNKHREIIYKRRQKILEKLAQQGADEGSALHKDVLAAIRKEGEAIVDLHATDIDDEKWNRQEIVESLSALHPAFRSILPMDTMKNFNDRDKLRAFIGDVAVKFYEEKCNEQTLETVAQAERAVTLRSIDTHWMDHIDDMSHLREQVAFSGYAQRDPLIEYQDQGYQRFQRLIQNIESTITRTLMQIDFGQFAPREVLRQAEEELKNISTNEDQISGDLEQTGVGSLMQQGGPQGQDAAGIVAQRLKANAPKQIHADKVGRNDPCPCGSGKKFKKCHGVDA